jgi:hypothetical protein
MNSFKVGDSVHYNRYSYELILTVEERLGVGKYYMVVNKILRLPGGSIITVGHRLVFNPVDLQNCYIVYQEPEEEVI